MRTRQALRVLRAQQIIRKTYGIRRGDPRYARVRFELLGTSVAVAIVHERPGDPTVVVRVARERSDGRVVRMLSESRDGFETLNDQVLYFESLYARYGWPVMIDRCSGCGRRDVATQTFRCTWPDRRVTVERHCLNCERTWQRQLRALGVRLEPVVQPEADTPADPAE